MTRKSSPKQTHTPPTFKIDIRYPNIKIYIKILEPKPYIFIHFPNPTIFGIHVSLGCIYIHRLKKKNSIPRLRPRSHGMLDVSGLPNKLGEFRWCFFSTPNKKKVGASRCYILYISTIYASGNIPPLLNTNLQKTQKSSSFRCHESYEIGVVFSRRYSFWAKHPTRFTVSRSSWIVDMSQLPPKTTYNL